MQSHSWTSMKKTAGEEHHAIFNQGGHDAGSSHQEAMIADLKNRLVVSIIVSIPVILLSPMVQRLFGYHLGVRGASFYLFILSAAVFLYGGWPFLTGFINELRMGYPGMMTLVGLAITVAFFYSSAVVLGFRGELFFWELVTLIDIMLLGHLLEMRSTIGATRALEKLARLLPETAHLIDGGSIVEVPVARVRRGQRLLVKPGERIPADGVVVTGESHIDESMLTGESMPVRRVRDDRVIGGSINGEGSLEVEITGVGEASYVSRVIGLVRDAQRTKSATQRLADRAARWLTMIALVAGAATFAGWIVAGAGLRVAVERMAAVMIIACPHALGLAVPLVVAFSTTSGARNGLLIRNRTAFERARLVSVVVFDKTGTLTEGTFSVEKITSHDPAFHDEKIIQYAASLERYSGHPLGRAIVRRAKDNGVEFLEVRGFRALGGTGVEGTIRGSRVRLVGPGYLAENNLPLPKTDPGETPYTTAYLLVEAHLVASISQADTIRPESRAAIGDLQRAGIRCIMMTGDNEAIARHVADTLGLDEVYAGVLPERKESLIRGLQAGGAVVAMTGDGINDAPALARADIGIAVGSGTDIAAETADIILVDSNPRNVAAAILFGRATWRKMVQNIAWAAGYNLVAIPLAAGVLYGYGILVSPALGAALMSLSTIIVAVNASLLEFRKPGAPATQGR